MSRIGRYLSYGVVVLARIAGRYEPWLFWPVSAAEMTRIARYLPYGVAVLARVAGRYEPCWPLFVVWRGRSGPYRWPL